MRGRKPAKWSEKELELYTYKHMDILVETMCGLSAQEAGSQLLGSQIATSAGILDALLLANGFLHIIEFKAEKATERCLGQLQRYRAAIERQFFDDVLHENQLPQDVCFIVSRELLVSPRLVVIAPSFDHRVTLGADICIQVKKRYGAFEYEVFADADLYHRENPRLRQAMMPWVHNLIDIGKEQALILSQDRDATAITHFAN